MKLVDAIDEYIGHMQAAGRGYVAQITLFRHFSRSMGDVEVRDVPPEAVRRFLENRGTAAGYRRNVHCTLGRFYRYLIAQGHAVPYPLPSVLPKRPADFTPYIYSIEELRRLLAATDSYYRCKTQRGLHGGTFRALLLLLYGAGLRISEALSLTLADVNLRTSLLTIRESKFYKTRLVPIGADLNRVLRNYMREQRPALRAASSDPLFVSHKGSSFTRGTAEKSFRRLRTFTGLHRPGGPYCQPRLHDLRHTFAVHRLLIWYRAGADVQRLLPHLATYLGHRELSGTQRYLTMTPELLREAGMRFQAYAMGGTHD
jgi:integrase/recombinase XerD